MASDFWGRLVPKLHREERAQLERAIGGIVLTEAEGQELLKQTRRDVPAAIIEGCGCPLCNALRKLATLQTP